MLRHSGWVLGAIVLLITAPALAQRPGGGPGRGFGGGFGTGGATFGARSELQLASSEAVQKELAMSEQQVAKVEEFNSEFREKARETLGDFQGIRDLQPEERRERMAEIREKTAELTGKLNEQYRAKLADVLDAVQMERLQQIKWQAAGVGALQDAELAKALDLSQEQRQKIDAAFTQHREKMGELTGATPSRENFRERAAQMRELTEARDKQVLGILNPSQQETFAQVKGEEFDLAQLQTGRRGFGGEGARGRGQRPGGEGTGRPGRGQRPGGGRPQRPE